jgi:DNA-binding NarL/FixJ family response regulator
MDKIRILIVEKGQFIRNRITHLREGKKNFIILTCSSEVNDTTEEIRKLNPDIILVDVGLVNKSYLTFFKTIKKDVPSIKIIVTGLKKDQEDFLKYIQARINGFTLKESTPQEILVTIKRVQIGFAVLPSILTNRLFSQIVDNSKIKVNFNYKKKNNISNREAEVIQLLSDGKSNKQIGNEMKISTYTVKSHIHNIMEKLTLHTRLEIANHKFESNTNHDSLEEKNIS